MHLSPSVNSSSQGVVLGDLPLELWSNVLASFCDGKSISTFLLATLSSRQFDAYQVVQDALVERFTEIVRTIEDPDIADTLQMLLAEIRTYKRTSSTFTIDAMKLLSHKCAILDYFETHLIFGNNWLVWCGQVDSFYGKIHAYIVSPYWSISAIASWYRDLELTQFSLVRPRFPIDKPQGPPFGSVVGRGHHDADLLDRLRVKLEPHMDGTDFWKGLMTAIQFAYDQDPALIVSPHSFSICEGTGDVHIPPWLPHDNSLCCYWEDFESYDEDDLLNLGDHIVRLMERFCSSDETTLEAYVAGATLPSFREAWGIAVAQCQGMQSWNSAYDEIDESSSDEEEDL